jgi:hypothetical protein
MKLSEKSYFLTLPTDCTQFFTNLLVDTVINLPYIKVNFCFLRYNLNRRNLNITFLLWWRSLDADADSSRIRIEVKFWSGSESLDPKHYMITQVFYYYTVAQYRYPQLQILVRNLCVYTLKYFSELKFHKDLCMYSRTFDDLIRYLTRLYSWRIYRCTV